MSLPEDSSCEGRVSLHFTQPGLSMPAVAGVVDEKGSEYILAHTGPRELDGHPPGVCGSWVWFSCRLYLPFGKGPDQHIIRCLKNKKCENERNDSGSDPDFCHDVGGKCLVSALEAWASPHPHALMGNFVCRTIPHCFAPKSPQ